MCKIGLPSIRLVAGSLGHCNRLCYSADPEEAVKAKKVRPAGCKVSSKNRRFEPKLKTLERFTTGMMRINGNVQGLLSSALTQTDAWLCDERMNHQNTYKLEAQNVV